MLKLTRTHDIQIGSLCFIPEHSINKWTVTSLFPYKATDAMILIERKAGEHFSTFLIHREIVRVSNDALLYVYDAAI